jgi:N-acetylmuramoyl-L-alanine amidase
MSAARTVTQFPRGHHGLLPALATAWIVLLACLCPAVECLAGRFHTVVLDPGHGGRDKGACWYGVMEKDLALDVARRVEHLLRNRGLKTVMTRRSDVFVTLDQRAVIANRYPGSIFVSIHFNAHTSRSIKGLETFYSSETGKSIAHAVQRRIVAKIRGKDRGIKKGSYAVLLRTRAPAILVEGGFISNLSECRRCLTEWYRQTLAQAIADGILSMR